MQLTSLGGGGGTINNNNSSKCNNQLLSSSSEEDEDGYNGSDKRRSRLKKCSSLKTTKTNSNGTDCCSSGGGKISKKIVRFADVLGLDLERVKTFLDEIPKVPPSAFKDLSLASELNSTFTLQCTVSQPQQVQTIKPPNAERIILPNFHQPFTQTNFYQQLHEKRVMLETAYSDNSSYIIGNVRVLNIGFEKQVFVRYSQDDWVSWQEIPATYNASCHDVTTDKFTFSLYMHNRLSFALRYTVNGQEYWDNNSGANYSFNSIPNAVPTAPVLYNNHAAASSVYNQVHW